MIYSPRAHPQMNESHIRGVPKNNWLIFHIGEVLVLRCKTVICIFFVVLTRVRLPETNSFPPIGLTIEERFRKHVLGFPRCKIV